MRVKNKTLPVYLYVRTQITVAAQECRRKKGINPIDTCCDNTPTPMLLTERHLFVVLVSGNHTTPVVEQYTNNATMIVLARR